MPKYTCERCLKDFSQKSHYDKHQNKKRPCQDNKGKIEEIVENIIIKNKKISMETMKINEPTQNEVQHGAKRPAPAARPPKASGSEGSTAEQSSTTDLLLLLNKILETKSYKFIAENLNVSVGTVKRWNILKNVPRPYIFDLMKIAAIPIDYSKFTFTEKCQFYTPIQTAKYCYSTALTILKKYGDVEADYIYIEPSAGNGNFLKVLPVGRRIGLDIEPKPSLRGSEGGPEGVTKISEEIIEADYLSWTPVGNEPPERSLPESGTTDQQQTLFATTKSLLEPRSDFVVANKVCCWRDEVPNNKKNRYIVIGNPPFGLRGQLALKFINHSNKFADYVCFILPQLFESDGKGVPRKRIKGFNLIHSEKITSDFESPENQSIKIECIFQVWSKFHTNLDYNIKTRDDSVMTIYSLSDGGTSSTTRNKKMFDKCDIYIPSTCFGKDNMRYYRTFNELPRRKGYGVVFNKDKKSNIIKFKNINWTEIAFLSTNSAYNIRTSQIAEQFRETRPLRGSIGDGGRHRAQSGPHEVSSSSTEG
jgi:hypothetical protein